MDRRMEVLKYLTKEQKGIEIGPWFTPLASKREGYDCLTFDVFDAETLKKTAESDPFIDNSRIADIEDVDVVGSSTEIETAIAKRGELGQFDYIISSHNFEHLPNPIKFLQGCGKVLKPGGYLSMAVPDKRACFDYFKPVSTTGEWLEAFYADRDRPTEAQIFDQNSLHSRFWENGQEFASFSLESDPRQILPMETLQPAFEAFKARRANAASEYCDAHCWMLTPNSLHALVLDACFLGLVNFRIAEISENNGNEFYVHLRNEPSAPMSDADFYARRRELVHAVNDDCAFNSSYAYGLREQAKKFDYARLEREVSVLKESRDEITSSISWKLVSWLWRFETRSLRKARQRLEDRKLS